MAKNYNNKRDLERAYNKYGSTRNVAKHYGVSQQTILYWMKKFGIRRIPRFHLFFNNSGKGRLGELYILGHPYFKKDVIDLGELDDKNGFDLLWKGSKVNVKTSHYKVATFRIKVKRHKASFYICLHYDDKVNRLIPLEIWTIPASKAPHSGIKPSLRRMNGKYHPYKLSLKRGKEFDAKEESKYNRWFTRKYSKKLKEDRNTSGGINLQLSRRIS